ncbi:hypothetical protein ACFVT2_31105 [Streptomyces sp. NPDC058000]|uniref:hypothetical protein n=1 Tax=Streptomyces sp. NPDC058000 TaxID=3346299 RepID=UPI0036E773A6
MNAAAFVPAGLFSLASSVRFLEGFTPASHHHAADGILRLAFPADDATSVVAAAIQQDLGTGGGTGTDYALAELCALPGIGPFSAELVLIRGAGHPDVLPRHEPRVHRVIATAYGLDAPAAADIARLARAADRWRPYRSWVATLLCTRPRHAPAGPRVPRCTATRHTSCSRKCVVPHLPSRSSVTSRSATVDLGRPRRVLRLGLFPAPGTGEVQRAGKL